jgi:hypothetical protein
LGTIGNAVRGINSEKQNTLYANLCRIHPTLNGIRRIPIQPANQIQNISLVFDEKINQRLNCLYNMYSGKTALTLLKNPRRPKMLDPPSFSAQHPPLRRTTGPPGIRVVSRSALLLLENSSRCHAYFKWHPTVELHPSWEINPPFTEGPGWTCLMIAWSVYCCEH